MRWMRALLLSAMLFGACKHVPLDSDGDLLPDALEDKNHNGRVDPGETDPRRADTDGDRIADGVEDLNRNGRRDLWESSPLLADTDGDGVSDGREDKNRNGRLDVGETSAVLPCAVWGPDGFCAPVVPEPMMVDLVRGLGSRAGELEANVLAVVRLGEGRVALAWAPEVEVAVADGWSAELELPLVDQHLEATKVAVQGTLAVTHRGRAVHGLQLIGEARITDEAMSLSALYLLSARVSERASMNLMTGPWVGLTPHGKAWAGLLLSPSLYADVSPGLSLGLEVQLGLSTADRFAVTATPQVRWRLSRVLLLQAGAGAAIGPQGLWPFVASRVSFEL